MESTNLYLQAGDNNVKGQGFLRQQGGGVVTFAGSAVMMLPATSFFREAIGHFRSGNTPQIRQVSILHSKA